MIKECDHTLGLYEHKAIIDRPRALLKKSSKEEFECLLAPLHEFKYCPECGEKLNG